MNKYTTFKFSTNFCLPHRSLLLSVFYLFQNADLLENSIVKRLGAQDFIDNIIFIATQADLPKIISRN